MPRTLSTALLRQPDGFEGLVPVRVYLHPGRLPSWNVKTCAKDISTVIPPSFDLPRSFMNATTLSPASWRASSSSSQSSHASIQS